MSISPQEVHQILSEPPYDTFIPFEKSILITEDKPHYKEIESRFGHIMMDLELNGEQKIATLEIPKDKLWDFYCEQVKDDHEIPSPEYLVNCILKKHDHRLLESLAIIFNRHRISYRQQFLDANGINLLVNYLKKFSIDIDSTDNQKSMPHVFKCLQNIANSIKFGPTCFDGYIDEMLPILMELMVKLPFNENFALILSIISGCFISASKGPINSNIQKTVKLLKKQPPIFWSNLKKVVHQKNPEDIQTLVNFTQILILLRTNQKERFDVSTMFAVNEYIQSIRDLSNPLFRNSLTQFDSDCEILSQFSSRLSINPFSIKSLSRGLKENSKLKQVLRSILLSLNDILKNYETVSINQDTFIFIHNFLLIHRHYLAKNVKSKLFLTAFSASENPDPIKIPYDGPNSAYRLLNKDSFFVNDEILKNSNISDYGKFYQKMPEDSKIPVLKQKIEEYKVYIKKLKDSHHIANAVHFEQEEILGQLKSLRTENLHLKALVASLREKLSKYEEGKENLIDTKNITDKNIQLDRFKAQTRKPESQITAEKEQNQNLNDQIQDLKIKNKEISINSDIEDLKSQLQQVNNENKEIQTQFDQAKIENKDLQTKLEQTNNENKEIQIQLEQSSNEAKELQTKLEQTTNENKNLISQVDESNNEINSLKLKIEELQTQLNEFNKENEDLKQTIQNQKDQNKNDENYQEKEADKEHEPSEIIGSTNDEPTNLQTQLEQANNENKELQTKFEQTSNENKEIQTQLEQANNENKEIQTQLEQANNENKELQTKLEQTSNENKNLISQVDESNNEINSLKLKIEELQTQLNESNKENEDLKQTIQNQKDQNKNDENYQEKEADKEHEPTKITGSTNNEHINLQTQNEQTNNENKELQTQPEQINNENKEIQTQLEQANNENKELQTKLEQTTNENKNLISQVDESNNEINSLKLKIEELQTQLNESNKENEDLKQTIQNQKDQNTNSNSNNNNNENGEDPPLTTKEENVETEESHQSESNQTKHEQNQPQQSTENDSINVQSQPEQASDENKELQAKFDQLSSEITELRTQLSQSSQTIDNLKKRLQLSESENDRLRNEEINNLKTQLESSNSKSNDDFNSSFDSTDISSPTRSNNRSLTENSLILDQLASQQQQIELLRKQLNEYESKEWGKQLNPSYDLQNADSDEIQNLREELKNAKEELEQYKSANNDENISDFKLIEVMKDQLNQKIAENEELKMKLESTLIEYNDFKEKSAQPIKSNNDDNDNSNADDSSKSSPAKKKFSFRNLLKK